MNQHKKRHAHQQLVIKGLHDILEEHSRSEEAHKRALQMYLDAESDLPGDIQEAACACLLKEVMENLCDNNKEKAKQWLNRTAREHESPTPPASKKSDDKKGQRGEHGQARQQQKQPTAAPVAQVTVEQRRPSRPPVAEVSSQASVTHLPVPQKSGVTNNPLTVEEINRRVKGKDAPPICVAIVREILATTAEGDEQTLLLNHTRSIMQQYYEDSGEQGKRPSHLSKKWLKRQIDNAPPAPQQAACA